jgi:hypothetical protein
MRSQKEFDIIKSIDPLVEKNLKKLEQRLEDCIQASLNKNDKVATTSFPANPKEDPGSNIFLISTNRKSFDYHFDPKIIDLLKEAGYESEVSSRRDSVSGVLHYTISVKLK